MNREEKNTGKNKEEQHQPNVLPATEIAKNLNPGANKNIQDKTSKVDKSTKEINSEITDGEDA